MQKISINEAIRLLANEENYIIEDDIGYTYHLNTNKETYYLTQNQFFKLRDMGEIKRDEKKSHSWFYSYYVGKSNYYRYNDLKWETRKNIFDNIYQEELNQVKEELKNYLVEKLDIETHYNIEIIQDNYNIELFYYNIYELLDSNYIINILYNNEVATKKELEEIKKAYYMEALKNTHLELEEKIHQYKIYGMLFFKVLEGINRELKEINQDFYKKVEELKSEARTKANKKASSQKYNFDGSIYQEEEKEN